MEVRRWLLVVTIFLVTTFSDGAFGASMRTDPSHSGDYLSLLMVGSVSKVEDVSTSRGTLQEREYGRYDCRAWCGDWL